MTDSESGGSGVENAPPALRSALDDYLVSRGKGGQKQSGIYRRHAERELGKFVTYLEREGIDGFDGIEARTLRRYIRQELLGHGHSPRTVQKYYDYVSAWLGWAQREGLIDTHYGIQEAAREPLPEADTRKEEHQQTWQRGQRQAILGHVDERAREAIEEDGLDAYGPVRNRALVYVLAYSGVRGSELLANSQDDRRDGAMWRDLADGCDSLEVLGKNQRWEDRSIPPQARTALERWRTVLDPAPEWPLFPTLHYPSLHDALDAAGVERAVSGHAEIFDALRDTTGRPPSITTDGARRLLKRLTDEADIDVEAGYLQLHGARRGVGRVLAMQQGADAAADQLGNSVEVVERRYSDILAAERAEKTGEAFDEHDG